MRAKSANFKKALPKLNNRQFCENSPILVTLIITYVCMYLHAYCYQKSQLWECMKPNL
jgi:hypothetical protein